MEEIERLVFVRGERGKKLSALSPREFENYTAGLFIALEYLVQQTPLSGDGGKDLIIHKDGKKYLVECKRYSGTNSVGRPLIQQFLGAITEEKATGGFFVTTSRFTKGMEHYARENSIILIDGSRLHTIIENVYSESKALLYKALCTECGEEIKATLDDSNPRCSLGHEIKCKIMESDLHQYRSTRDSVYDGESRSFRACSRCGSRMVIRYGKYGQFWGCIRYPLCKNTRQL
ncbi:MAG: restriction endonuclease [Bacillota bacterium]|nr:restriction endonuclease [Bacillota bacterium]